MAILISGWASWIIY